MRFWIIPGRMNAKTAKYHGKTRCYNIASPRVFSTEKGEKDNETHHHRSLRVRISALRRCASGGCLEREKQSLDCDLRL